MEWGMGRDVASPAQPTRGSGERRELPHWGPDKPPAGNTFWRILKATKRSFLHSYAAALSSSNSFVSHFGDKTNI